MEKSPHGSLKTVVLLITAQLTQPFAKVPFPLLEETLPSFVNEVSLPELENEDVVLASGLAVVVYKTWVMSPSNLESRMKMLLGTEEELEVLELLVMSVKVLGLEDFIDGGMVYCGQVPVIWT